MQNLGRYFHERFYLVDRPTREIWDTYTGFRPDQVWSGPIAQFGLLIDPLEKKYKRPATRYRPFRRAIFVAVDLFFEYMVHLPAVFEITSIDQSEMAIVFTYVEQNRSSGTSAD